MDYQLKGKTALITGSTAGIGFATAAMLAKEGCHIILNGRSASSVDEARRRLNALVPGASAEGYVCDFERDQPEMPRTEVDILVNNVGIYSSQSFMDMNDSEWERHFKVNVMSGVALSRLLFPSMKTRGWGRIIFISSECAALVPQDLIAYSATKAALHAISRGLAQMTPGTGVTVNTVMPGSTLSEGAERFLTERAAETGQSVGDVEKNFFREVRTSSLLQRFAHTDEVAQMITYLASPLSSATNGAVLKVDGGSVPGIL